MAREFFKNLPNTTTPLTAPRMNALLDGDEAMGNIVVDSVRSKNLLSFGNWENTANNITCKSENGKITITGTFGSETNFYRDCNLDLKAGTTYVISKNQSNQGFYPYFILRNGETQVARVNNTDGYITYTPETDIHIDGIMIFINGTDGVNCTLYPQVEIGTTPTDYSEYKGLGYVSGSNYNGRYMKFDDGTLICYKTISGNTNTTTINPWGSLYYADVPNGNWSYTFTSIDNVQVTNNSNQFWCMINNPANLSAGITRIVRPDNNNQTYSIQLLAIGKWK